MLQQAYHEYVDTAIRCCLFSIPWWYFFFFFLTLTLKSCSQTCRSYSEQTISLFHFGTVTGSPWHRCMLTATFQEAAISPLLVKWVFPHLPVSSPRVHILRVLLMSPNHDKVPLFNTQSHKQQIDTKPTCTHIFFPPVAFASNSQNFFPIHP